MTRYQSPHDVPAGERPDRTNSYAFAMLVLPTGDKKPIYAGDIKESLRPSSDMQFICPSCDEPMHWVVGTKKRNQPEIPIGAQEGSLHLGGEVDRGDSYFQHDPGHLDKHIRNESRSIGLDIVQFVYEKGKDEGLDPVLTGDGKRKPWIVTYNFERDGKRVKLPFVISPEPSLKLSDDEDAIIFTSSTGKFGDCKRFTLRASNGHTLSAIQVRDNAAKGRTKDILVSGFYVLDHRVGNGTIKFVPRLLKIGKAIDSLVQDVRVWIDGVDSISWTQFPSNARFALINREELGAAQTLLLGAKPNIDRKNVTQQIVDLLGIDSISDTKYVNNKHRYGGGDILYVYLGAPVEKDSTRLTPPSQKQVLINPSGAELLRDLKRSDWENTLVLFVGDDFEINRMREEFFKKINDVFDAAERKEMNLEIRKATTVKRALPHVHGFLSSEIEIRAEQRKGRVEPVQGVLALDLGLGKKS